MEEIIYEEVQITTPLPLDGTGQRFLSGAAQWAKFLAIVSFVMCGLLAIFALTVSLWMPAVAGSYGGAASVGDVTAMGAGFLTVTYLISAGIMFVITLFLYRFAVKAQQALAQRDSQLLGASFGDLNSCFKIYGIITIIGLAFLALALVFGLIGMAVAL